MKRVLSRMSVCTGLLAVQFFVAAPAQAQKDGDLWEVTTEMSMAGMPAGMSMPGQTRNVCARRNSDRPAGADNDRCETYDTKRTANTYSWKARCQNPPSTGTGEIVYEGRDRYRGTITMNSEGRDMTMKLLGRRIGECDYGAQQAQVQQQVAAAQRQSQQAMDQMCSGAVQSLTPHLLRPETGYKCDAKYKADFCSRLQTAEGFAVVAARRRQAIAGMPSGDLKEGADFCGVDGEDIRNRLCRRAEQQESLDFLGSSCIGYGTPGFGSAIVARECAGRTFSTPPAEKYRGFCGAVARQGLMQPQSADAGKKAAAPAKAAEAKPEPATEDNAVDMGKRLLKGIFGR